MSDRETLERALETLYEYNPDERGRNTTPVRYPLDVIGAAAQKYLDLLIKSDAGVFIGNLVQQVRYCSVHARLVHWQLSTCSAFEDGDECQIMDGTLSLVPPGQDYNAGSKITREELATALDNPHTGRNLALIVSAARERLVQLGRSTTAPTERGW